MPKVFNIILQNNFESFSWCATMDPRNPYLISDQEMVF